jgi:Transglutaminase-like superfamily
MSRLLDRVQARRLGRRGDDAAEAFPIAAGETNARRFDPRGIVRHTIPMLFLPLCLVASALAATPWLRAFPSSFAAAPLYGAAILSVLVPLLTAAFGPRWLWLGFVVDVVVFVAYTLLVVLHDATGFSSLVDGIYHGPSQVLTYALPLVSPRSLMVAPVALTWLAGALAGECIARRWYTLLPYIGFLISFGLAYAGSQRAAGSDLDAANTHETVLAALILITLLLMRVAQAWVHQDEAAETTQPDGALPMRGLVIGTVTTLLIATGASLLVQTTAFPKQANEPERIPSTSRSERLTPLSFVASLRPRTAHEPPRKLFTVMIDKDAPGYFPIANVDFYDGSGWTFDRTFRPSGGVLPDDLDSALNATHTVTQRFVINSSAMARAPWMPVLYRPSRITGTSVNIDPSSGMVVPAGALSAGSAYSVVSQVDTTTFDHLAANSAAPDSTTPAVDTELPATLRATLDKLVDAFSRETGVHSAPALPFLQALQRDLSTRYSLSPAAQAVATATPTPSPTPSSNAGGPTSPSSGGQSRSSEHASGAGTSGNHPSSPAGTDSGQSGASSHQSAQRHPGTRRHHPQSAGQRALNVRSTGSSAARPGNGAAQVSRSQPHSPANRSTAHGGGAQPSSHPSASASASQRPTAAPSSAAPSAGGAQTDLAGGTGFAEVLASVLGHRNGTPEQYATLVALVARDLGVPARVATGFRVPAHGGGSLLTPSTYEVTSAEAWTWVEVPVVGSGWVVLDASPGRYVPTIQPTQKASAEPNPSTAPPSQNALQTQGNNGNAVAPPSSVPTAITSASKALIIALSIVFGLLLIALLLGLFGRKPLRAARRRRSPDPRARLIGAWQESLDVLTEAGLPELSTLTSAEVAALAGEQFGARPRAEAESLGTAANAVAYSVHTQVATRDADAAWERHRVLRKQVRAVAWWRACATTERARAAVRSVHRRGRRMPGTAPNAAPTGGDTRADDGACTDPGQRCGPQSERSASVAASVRAGRRQWRMT